MDKVECEWGCPDVKQDLIRVEDILGSSYVDAWKLSREKRKDCDEEMVNGGKESQECEIGTVLVCPKEFLDTTTIPVLADRCQIAP